MGNSNADINADIDMRALQESTRNGTAATFTYVLILTSIIFDVFIFCYIGQLVADQVSSSRGCFQGCAFSNHKKHKVLCARF